MANPSIVVDFIANTSGLKKGIGQANSSAGAFGSTLKGLGKTGALAAGAAGVGALAYTLKVGIGEFAEGQKVAAQTAAAIKSTGGAANVTAGQINELATSLMKKSGVDDEAIASGENLLLTFTNIHNEAGKGNDIFNQATATMLDMSTALGQDMKSSAMQLGKALNDPVKGMTALQRVGVTFTDTQKEMVKGMVASGDTLGAQKVILAELNKEFGGSAEAMGKTLPGQIDILKQTFNNFAGELVGRMVPALETTVAFLKENWPEISRVLKQVWASVQPILAALIELIVAVVTAIRDNWGTIGPIVTTVANYVKAAATVIADVLKVLAALLRGDWSAAWRAFQTLIVDVVNLIKAAITLQLLPLKLLLTTLWAGIKLAAESAWNLIKAAVITPVNAIKSAVDSAFNAMRSTINTVVGAIKTAIGGLETFINNARAGISSGLGRIADLFDKPADAARSMLDAIKSAVGAIEGVIRAAIGGISRAISSVVDAIKRPINAVLGQWNAIQFTIPTIDIPSVTIAGKKIGGGSFGGQTWGVPDIPLLAKGGVVSSPTLAMVGEGAGREIVAPESLLRQIMAEQAVQVRVFIGDRELTDMVRVEVADQNTGLARSLLAGASA